MASQTNIKLSCTVGNFTFYKMYDNFYMRSKVVSVKQTIATKKAALVFGKANRLEKALRTTLYPVIPTVKSKPDMRRLVNSIAAWLRTNALQTTMPLNALAFITGFEYNEASPLTARFKISIQVMRTAGNKLLLQLPAFIPATAITAPAYTTNIVCTIMAATCTAGEPAATGCYSTQLTIPYNNEPLPAQDIPLDIITAPGCLTIVVIALQYYKGEPLPANAVTGIRWLPAGFVAALYN